MIYKKIPLLLFFVFCSLVSTGQVDSLIRILPQLKGEKKILTFCDISYFYSGNDPIKGMYYGRLALKDAKQSKNKKLILQSLSDMSISFINASKYDTVLILANEALKIATILKDDLSKGKAYNRIAMSYFEKGMHKECIDYNFKALKIFEKEKQIPYQGLILTNIAASYEKLGLLEEAIESNNKVLEIAKIANSNEMYSSAYGNLGIIYMKKGDYKRADQYYEKSLPYIDEQRDKKRISILYQNIGVNARLMGNSQKGIQFYKKALLSYRETKDQLGLGYIYFNLANCLLDVNQVTEASSYIDSGYVIAKEIKSLPLIRDAFRALSRKESLNGNFEKADQYFEQYEKFRDSISNIDKIKAISTIQTKYKVQAKEKELLKQKADKEELQKKLYATGGIALSLALILLLVWQRQKLKLRKKELETLHRLSSERTRIARDLHDNLGAELTVVSSKLDTKIFKTEKQNEKEELEKIADVARNAGIVLRETVWSINSEQLTIDALKRKIEEFFERINISKNLTLNINIEQGNNSFSPLIVLNLYRITQESITNTVKYAQAKTITIDITPKSLVIKDDGIGFDMNIVRKGYGLNNIENRAKDLGSTAHISSSNEGTVVKIDISSS